MREHLYSTTLPHMANMAGTHWRHGQILKGDNPLPAELSGEVFHPDHREQLKHHESHQTAGRGHGRARHHQRDPASA